jgi:hypothetical protein
MRMMVEVEGEEGRYRLLLLCLVVAAVGVGEEEVPLTRLWLLIVAEGEVVVGQLLKSLLRTVVEEEVGEEHWLKSLSRQEATSQ